MAQKHNSEDWGGSSIMSMLCNRNRMIKRFHNGGSTESGTNSTVENWIVCASKAF